MMPGVGPLTSLAGIGVNIGLPQAPPAAKAGFGSLFGAGLPNVILGALMGGGNLTQSIGSLAGGSALTSLMGSSLGSKISGGLSSLLGKGLGGALSAAIPGVGGLIGAGLGSLVGKMFGPTKTQIEGRNATATMEDQKRALLDMYGGLEKIRTLGQAVGVDLAGVFSMPMKGVDGLAHMNKLMEEFTAKTDALSQATQKYGLTLDDLGPKFQAMQTQASLKELLDDWHALEDSGANMDAVLKKMAPSFTDVIEQALKFGVEVDPQLQDVVTRLQDMGLLVDDAGKKIDATGLKFQAFGTMGVDAAGDVRDALDKIPDNVHTRIKFDWEGKDDFPGGPGGRNFSQGGVVYAADGFIPRGTDTVPAMLTPGEGVLSRRGMQALGRLNSGAGVGGVVVNVDARGALFPDRESQHQLGKIVSQVVARRLPGELRKDGAR
jgi:hypothetical protein